MHIVENTAKLVIDSVMSMSPCFKSSCLSLPASHCLEALQLLVSRQLDILLLACLLLPSPSLPDGHGLLFLESPLLRNLLLVLVSLFLCSGLARRCLSRLGRCFSCFRLCSCFSFCCGRCLFRPMIGLPFYECFYFSSVKG